MSQDLVFTFSKPTKTQTRLVCEKDGTITFTKHNMPKPTSNVQLNHSWAELKNLKNSPPIPEFNYIIDNQSLEILQDLTGQP